VRGSLVKFDARPAFDHRVQVSRAKIEIHYYEYGWEDFWFPFNSQFNGMGIVELLEISTSSERIDPNRKNISVIFDDFWNHPTWQHGILAVAVLETILMAFLGTLTATLIGLPLAFAAANNINSVGFIRFGIKRIFDFVRGIDYLIWSLIFIRSFGLGPLTGALAIAFTDTGTLGKLFSEALENIDSRQKEGIQSTGSDSIQQLRFGIIPQILPVLTSQILYYFESNVRSATVIGALGAGGIGLVLVETMRTQRDWENVLYIIIVTLTIVILIDSLSSRLRRKLIQG
jgi:phosphonate transport system permease protein